MGEWGWCGGVELSLVARKRDRGWVRRGDVWVGGVVMVDCIFFIIQCDLELENSIIHV